jgi:amino acid efflux transporter
LVATAAFHVQTQTLVSLTAGLIVTVYAIGVTAAFRLLPRGKGRTAAIAAFVAVALLLAATAAYLAWAAVVSAAALLYYRLSRPYPPSVTLTE